MSNSQKTILTFGTFDKFHPGHHYYLTEAKKHGKHLVVIIARDNNVEQLKGKLPKHTEQERLQSVKAFKGVDEAMLGFEDFSKRHEIIQLVKPDVICLGYDQAPNFKSPNPDIKVIRIDAFEPETYKSSLL